MAKSVLKTLGKYVRATQHIGESIGKGAFGKVYKGLNTETGQTVAIKQLSLINIAEDKLASLHKEINLLKKLSHENIVKYIDAIATDRHLNIILEFVESGSLAANIKKYGPLSEKLVGKFVRQILQGLTYLHSQGIVHRDIKGANILMTKDSLVKLADFGVATKLSETVKSMSFAGTPYWMAPEIIENGHGTSACDVWSLGCTVIELITGFPPYNDMDPMPAMYRLVQDPHPPLPRDISPALRDFLLACFQKEPLIRIPAAALLSHPFVLQSLEAVSPVPQPPTELDDELETSPSPLHRRSVARTDIHGSQLISNDTIEEASKEDSAAEVPALPLDRVKNVRSLLSKSTRVTSEDLTSPRAREKSMSFADEGVRTSKIVKDFEICDDLSKLRNLLDSLKATPELKDEVLRSLAGLKDLLEETDDLEVEHTALQLLNQATESDTSALTVLALSGILPTLLRYTERHFPREIRVEAGFLVAQLMRASPHTLKLFLAAGGADRVMLLLDDSDYETNKDLLVCGLDCLIDLHDKADVPEQLLSIWTRIGAIERVLAALESLLCDPDDLVRGHILKAAKIIEMFARGPDVALTRLTSPENLELAFSMLPLLSRDMSLCFIRAFRLMCANPGLHARLENAGMVPSLVSLLQQHDKEPDCEETGLLLVALASLCRLSPARLEQAALADVCPSLLQVLTRNRNLESSLSLALGLVTASPVSRSKLRLAGGLDLLFQFLEGEHRDRVLESIATWSMLESSKIVWKDSYTASLVKRFVESSDSTMDLVLQSLLRVATSCEAFVTALGEETAFLKRMAVQLKTQQAVNIEKKLLELLLLMCSKCSAKALIDRCSLHPVLLHLQQWSEEESLVVLEEYVQMLLAAYASPLVPS